MLLFLFVLVCCLLCCELISRRSVFKGLTYDCRPSSRVVEPGQLFELVATLENNKWLPVSFLKVVQSLPADIQLDAYLGRFSSDVTSARLYSSCYLMPRQRLVRRITASLPRRGRHFVMDATLLAGDLLGLSQQQRDIHQFYEIVVLPRRVEAPDLSQALGGFFGGRLCPALHFRRPGADHRRPGIYGP